MRSCEWIRICERMKIGVKNMEAAAERMGRITMIDGPVVRASGLSRFAMGEMTEVGELALMGEILQIDDVSSSLANSICLGGVSNLLQSEFINGKQIGTDIAVRKFEMKVYVVIDVRTTDRKSVV